MHYIYTDTDTDTNTHTHLRLLALLDLLTAIVHHLPLILESLSQLLERQQLLAAALFLVL